MTWERKRVVSIVEGRGEEIAIPRIVDRWIREHRLYRDFQAEERAVCAKGVGRLTCAPGHQRGIEYFIKVSLARGPGAILIVFDADDECLRRSETGLEPLGVEISKRARRCAPPEVDIAVVVADREFEAWFVEHRHPLAFPNPGAWTGEVPIETVRDCKNVVSRLLARRYDPVIDQPALAALLPLASPSAVGPAAVGRSYRKLIASLAHLMPPVGPEP